MTSKYAEDIAAIREQTAQIPVLDERTEHIVKHLEDLSASQGKQWKAINKNALNIRELKTRISFLAGIQAFLSTALAGIAGWFGSQR